MAKWLDIALFKALRRIRRAVDLDDLSATVDELVRHTGSAVDVQTVLGQIGTFWRQLEWPDAETGYVFVSRILDDVCRATLFYAEAMGEKAKRKEEEAEEDESEEEDSGAEEEEERSRRRKRKRKKKRRRLKEEEKDEDEVVHFVPGHCLALNNVDFVMRLIQPFALELGTADVLERLEAQLGQGGGGGGGDVGGDVGAAAAAEAAGACAKTVRTLVRNAAENVEHQLLKVRTAESRLCTVYDVGQRVKHRLSEIYIEML